MTESTMILVFIASLVFVLWIDDGASDRWCKTYDFCENQEMNIEDDHE